MPDRMATPELQYEPSTKARPVVIEEENGLTRIVVAMEGPYAPVPKWVFSLDMLSLVVAPVWWVSTLLIRSCLRLPKPSRAIFEISGDRFKLRLHDRMTGEKTFFDWPRAAVIEARANRFDKGFWLNVPGHVKNTYLSDVPRSSIERLETALIAVLANKNAPVVIDQPSSDALC
jgi:hypothetical protein